jgi:pimeloyl-ACP methyl ester carboxylesterase
MAVQKKKISSERGVEIYYEVSYAKTRMLPMLFIHGMGGDLDAWDFVLDTLSLQKYSALAFDLRGHGYSTHPKEEYAYKKERIVRDILAILKAEDLKKVTVVGHCYGAIIAAHFAAKYPEYVSKLVLISGTLEPPVYVRSPLRLALAHSLIYLGAHLSLPPRKPWHSPYPKGKFHKDYELYGLLRTIYYNSLKSYLYTSREILDPELDTELGKIKAKTLVLVGESDTIFPPMASFNIHLRIKNSQFEILPKGNHPVILNQGPEVAKLIEKFITPKKRKAT